MISVLLHFLALAIILAFPVFGLGLGIYKTSQGMLMGKAEQPAVSSQIMSVYWLGIAMIEASCTFSVVFALIIAKFQPYTELTLAIAISEVAFAIAIGVSLCVTCAALGGVFGQGCLTVARQPLSISKVNGIIIFFIAFVEIVFLFGILIAFLIRTKISQVLLLNEAYAMLGGACCIAFGGIGPALGIMNYAINALKEFGNNKNVIGVLQQFSMMIILFIDMILIFSFVCSVLMILRPLIFSPEVTGTVLVCLSVATGLVGVGVAASISKIGSSVIYAVSREIKNYSSMSSFVGISGFLIETSLLFSMLMIIFVIFWFS